MNFKTLLKKNSTIHVLAYLLNQKYRHKQNFSNFTNKEKNYLLEIQRKGYAVIPNFLDSDFCKLCITDIEEMILNHPEFIHEHSDLRVFGAEELSNQIKKYAEKIFLFDISTHYNAEETQLGFCLANKIEFSEKSNKLGSGGGWHRDSISRQFKSILYLNDVDENNGSYQIIEKSHKLSNVLNDIKAANTPFSKIRFSDQQIEKILERDPSRLKTLTGKAGTLIIKDCSAIHRGSPLKTGKRYALTNYFFQTRKIGPKLIEHFSPLVSPEKVLNLTKLSPLIST